MHRWVRKALHPFEEDDYARLLALLKDARARRALESGSRDEAVRLILRATLAQPAVAAMLIRRLMRGSERKLTGAPGSVTEAAFEPWPAVSEAGES
jgi:hypothetical protein